MYKYIYFRIYRFYRDVFKEDIPGFYSLVVIIILQGLNLFSLVVISSSIFNFNQFKIITARNALVGFLVLLLSNYLIFFKITSFKILNEKWGNESPPKSRIKGLFILFYIIISILFAIYCFFVPTAL